MSVLFAVPLAVIALYESQVEHSRRFLELFPESNQEAEGDPAVEDPESDNAEGHQLCKKSFAELVEVFPDATLGDQATIINEIVRRPRLQLLNELCLALTAPKRSPPVVEKAQQEGRRAPAPARRQEGRGQLALREVAARPLAARPTTLDKHARLPAHTNVSLALSISPSSRKTLSTRSTTSLLSPSLPWPARNTSL